MQNKFYIADCHFGHKNIIDFDSRPFADVSEMDEKLIENWNLVVKKNDIIYVLGDFIWAKESQWPNYLERLKGQIVLIKGNHDPASLSSSTKEYLVEIKDYKETTDGKAKVIMCHYPMLFYKKDYIEDYWMFYGHVHDTEENKQIEDIRKMLLKQQSNDYSNKCHFINIGCMMPWMDYFPRTFTEIVERFNAQGG